ncbi:hypothetical protein H5410_015067 [Solanum commersonii]|uniref:Uncharacterized protein n=1 Tax=Solanum commersonii TaxID=4109 RepID=A0A9J5ZT12_SOLCO|nr:hypothetical protein H5410_015067 [Solanum commersonii]
MAIVSIIETIRTVILRSSISDQSRFLKGCRRNPLDYPLAKRAYKADPDSTLIKTERSIKYLISEPCTFSKKRFDEKSRYRF